MSDGPESIFKRELEKAESLKVSDERIDQMIKHGTIQEEIEDGSGRARCAREVADVRTRIIVDQPKPGWRTWARWRNPFRQYFAGWVVYVHVSCDCGCTNSVGISMRAPVPPNPELVADYTRAATIKGLMGFVQAQETQRRKISEAMRHKAGALVGEFESLDEFLQRMRNGGEIQASYDDIKPDDPKPEPKSEAKSNVTPISDDLDLGFLWPEGKKPTEH